MSRSQLRSVQCNLRMVPKFLSKVKAVRTSKGAVLEFWGAHWPALCNSSRACIPCLDIMGALKMQDVKMTDQVARHENAGHEIDGPSNKA